MNLKNRRALIRFSYDFKIYNFFNGFKTIQSRCKNFQFYFQSLLKFQKLYPKTETKRLMLLQQNFEDNKTIIKVIKK